MRAMEQCMRDTSMAAVRQRQAQLIGAQTYTGPSVLAAFDSRLQALERLLARQKDEQEKLLDQLELVSMDRRAIVAEITHLKGEFLKSKQDKEALLVQMTELKNLLSQQHALFNVN